MSLAEFSPPVPGKSEKQAVERIQVAALKQRPTTSTLRAGDDAGRDIFERPASWAALAPLEISPKRIEKSRIVTLSRSDQAHLSFDIMRTRILRQMRQNRWTSLAITSPTPGCGKTMICLNLAFSMAHRRECRAVVVDLDFRRPRIAKTLDMPPAASMGQFLRGQSPVEKSFLRYGDNLAIGASPDPVAHSAELLQSAAAQEALRELKEKLEPDVILYDLPPVLSSDDVLALLPNVDCLLLVAAAESSTLGEIDVCQRDLAEQTNLLGVVLNKCRYAPEKYGY